MTARPLQFVPRLKGAGSRPPNLHSQYALDRSGANHQAFVGTGHFDHTTHIARGGGAATIALRGSTEEEPFQESTPAPPLVWPNDPPPDLNLAQRIDRWASNHSGDLGPAGILFPSTAKHMWGEAKTGIAAGIDKANEAMAAAEYVYNGVGGAWAASQVRNLFGADHPDYQYFQNNPDGLRKSLGILPDTVPDPLTKHVLDSAETAMMIEGAVRLGSTALGQTSAKTTAAQLAAESGEAEARGGTYLLRDAETSQVMRTGRSNDLLRRQGEHFRDPLLKDYEFEMAHRTDVYAQQRGLEQELDWLYNPPLNYQSPISPLNPNLLDYLRAANEFLDK